MSSTNRGTKRAEYDYYRTPDAPIQALLIALEKQNIINPSTAHTLKVLDPCAGGDTTNPRMPYADAITERYNPTLTPRTIDIREDSPAQYHHNFVTHTNEEINDTFYDLIITNPPFDIATDIIKQAHLHARHEGYIIMLLRLNFWGSKQRQEFFKQYLPTHCFIHPKRMSFTPDNKTDSIEYAHFVWQRNVTPPYTKTFLLNH